MKHFATRVAECLLLCSGGACCHADPEPSRPVHQSQSNPVTETKAPTLCHNRGELDAAMGNEVRVVGQYQVVPIHSKGGPVIAHWPVIQLPDQSQVMLESFWKHQKGRSPDEVPEWVGKQVMAIGTLRPEPPKEAGAQNLIFPTLSPVLSLGRDEREWPAPVP